MPHYYWCLEHQRVEQGTVCKAVNRLGPYGSEEEARSWSERVEGRNDAWEAEDERWHGRPDD